MFSPETEPVTAGTDAVLAVGAGLEQATGDDRAWRLAAAFLLSCRSENTRRAYARDIRDFYLWTELLHTRVRRAHTTDSALRRACLGLASRPTAAPY